MLKLFVEQLAKPLTSTGEAERVEVEVHPDRLLCVVIQTDAGTFQLTESVDGSLHVSAPEGCLTLQPCNANSLDARVQKFGRAGRKRFERDSVSPK